MPIESTDSGLYMGDRGACVRESNGLAGMLLNDARRVLSGKDLVDGGEGSRRRNGLRRL